MKSSDPNKELEIFQNIISGLTMLDKETQIRLLQSAATFLQLELKESGKMFSVPKNYDAEKTSQNDVGDFSNRTEMSPKEFLLGKEPATAVARIACLAFYLTHYRNMPHFKTFDLSKLNTEAAQQKFSNPAQSVDDAAKCGFLVPATKGQKQISAIGEQYVQSLPDQEAAKQVLKRIRIKKRIRAKK